VVETSRCVGPCLLVNTRTGRASRTIVTLIASFLAFVAVLLLSSLLCVLLFVFDFHDVFFWFVVKGPHGSTSCVVLSCVIRL
jgi:hypothetical protein